MDSQNELQVSELLLRLRCGDISREELNELESIISGDIEAIEYCVDFLMEVDFFQQTGQINIPSISDNVFLTETADPNVNKQSSTENMPLQAYSFDYELWKMLGEDEQSALPVHIEKPLEIDEPAGPPIIKPARPEHKISKFSLFTLSFSTAAMLLFVVMILLTPERPVVGFLADSIDAEWIIDDEIPIVGEVLRRGSFTLVSGYAKIVFDRGVEIVVESPATFELVTDNQMLLSNGKISAIVPSSAKGFIVQTPTASIIDYGTEFGVLVDEKANITEAHVFRGEVDLRDSSDPARFNATERLKVGMAASVAGGRISKVYKTDTELFVKELPSEYEMAIRRSNPKSYWRFAESLTNIIGDEKFTGLVEGEIGYKDIMTSCGQCLNVISFNSIESKGRLNYGNILNPGRDSFTVSMWIKPLSLEGEKRQFIATKRAYYKGWSIISIGDDITLRTGTGVDKNVWIGKKDCLTTDWHHVVMVIDRQANKLKGYLDGSGEGWNIMTQDEYWRASVEVTTDTYTAGAEINDGKDLTISKASDDFEGTDLAQKTAYDKIVSPFHGLVYDFAVWKRALNESEIRQLYDKCPLSNER